MSQNTRSVHRTTTPLPRATQGIFKGFLLQRRMSKEMKDVNGSRWRWVCKKITKKFDLKVWEKLMKGGCYLRGEVFPGRKEVWGRVPNRCRRQAQSSLGQDIPYCLGRGYSVAPAECGLVLANFFPFPGFPSAMLSLWRRCWRSTLQFEWLQVQFLRVAHKFSLLKRANSRESLILSPLDGRIATTCLCRYRCLNT